MNKIAIILRAGRLNYVNIVSDLLKSLRKFGHTENYTINLYISFDEKIARTGSRLDQAIESQFASVQYITDEDRQVIIEEINSVDLAPEHHAKLMFLQKPYGYQINSALFFAMAHGNDIALLFDDDQGFAAPVESSGTRLKWIYQDVVGWHIRCLQNGASITVGQVAGWRYPIPEQLTMVVPEPLRRELGRLFEYGTEMIDRDTFMFPEPRVLSQEEGRCDEWMPLPDHLGHRWICPANMGINLLQPFPVFYNPEGARGEDAFFSMSIDTSAEVVEIPAFVFHDPFLRYPGIYVDQFPEKLNGERLTQEHINRFADVVLGWTRYMPLFMLCRLNGDYDLYHIEIRKRQKTIAKISYELSVHLNSSRLLEMADCLEVSHQRVERDYQHWIEVNSAWEGQIYPWLRGPHPALYDCHSSTALADPGISDRKNAGYHSVPEEIR